MSRQHHKSLHVASGSLAGTVCGSVEVAETFRARFIGLLGRKGLAEDSGLWLNPSRGVHTFGMRFPIDVVALDGEMNVIGLYPVMGAWKVAATSPKTRSVLELPAGHIATSGIGLGERLSMRVRSKCGAEESVK